MVRKKRTKEPEKPIEVKEVGVLTVEPEIKLRENPICTSCGAKGKGYPKEGFAVLSKATLDEKLKEDYPDGTCKECFEHYAKSQREANAKNTKPRMKWLEENRKS